MKSIPALGLDFEGSKPTLEALIESVETGGRMRKEVLQSFVRVQDLVDLGILRLAANARALLNAQPSFAAVSFENSWANFSSDYHMAGYYRDAFGRVFLRGLIASGSVGSTAFTLPSGYRPEKHCLFSVVSNDSIGQVFITTAGAVTPISPSNNAWVSLEGISFVAVQ